MEHGLAFGVRRINKASKRGMKRCDNSVHRTALVMMPSAIVQMEKIGTDTYFLTAVKLLNLVDRKGIESVA